MTSKTRAACKRSLEPHPGFENYPVQMQTAVNGWKQTESSALSLENFSMAEETNYDLNVVIVPGEEFYVKFSYNAGIYDREDMKRIKGHILEVISCVTEDPDRLYQASVSCLQRKKP